MHLCLMSKLISSTKAAQHCQWLKKEKRFTHHLKQLQATNMVPVISALAGEVSESQLR